ncbi:redoxin domain-containing protein [Limobrevibacterium gyesilva]|uniref:Redoxin domain-containing protein n=1 Tax=Limobrevibacterium gyesilva TaxID=2991712 RepID=A0AA41YS68_9PROT|nr:redoxin domain-containing protein [Limobrevibacterium gyesilva]MCW3477746.1 redoxin domain-containing protein [Limobrevibacterium gyesilva]
MNSDRRTLLILPAALIGAGGVAVGGLAVWRLLRQELGDAVDPLGTPSVLTGRKVPPFRLPGLGGAGFGSLDLAAGQPVLVNFFAGWSRICVEQVVLLLDLKRHGVVIWGITFMEAPRNTAAFLERYGNPYARVAADEPGRVAVDWGVRGVPDTFLVNGEGIVKWHMSGPLTKPVVDRQLLPALRKVTS